MTREDAKERICDILEEATSGSEAVCYVTSYDEKALKMAIKALEQEPCEDCISRQAAIDAIKTCSRHCIDPDDYYISAEDAEYRINALPSAQPERTCVNCGRTINNGGWYADGRTRCPIEEHYALPKDGYCHLWEKRNVTDDDYPERREE